MTELRFTWDPKKAARNRSKHGIAFEEATSARKATRAEHRKYVERIRR